MSLITEDHKLNEAKRELNLRRQLYPRWVESGRIKKADADHRIAVMAEIVNDYEKSAKALGLFKAAGMDIPPARRT